MLIHMSGEGDPGRWRTALGVGLVFLIVVVFIAALVIAGRGTPKVHVGPPGPPYPLSVFFRQGVTTSQAKSALQRCSTNPEVIGIGLPSLTGGGTVTANVYTRHLDHTSGVSAGASDLFSCLKGVPSVAGFGYGE